MRCDDWLERLWAEVDAWKSEPFEYGRNDCCLFAARCVDAMTGSDWVEELRGHYHDKRTAAVYIKEAGGVEAGATARLGEPVPRLLARRGDVCLVETETGPGLAVCVGAHAVGPGADRQYSVPLSAVLKAWRVD